MFIEDRFDHFCVHPAGQRRSPQAFVSNNLCLDFHEACGVEVFDHALHDGGGRGMPTSLSPKDPDLGSRHALVRSYLHCLLN